MTEKVRQLSLFGEEKVGTRVRKTRNGGSLNPIVFRDYEAFVAKFQDKEKTTDDTFTPRDVYEAVVRYVGEVYDLSGKVILRPFYPGGDYEHAEYPENGVVIDNPPFSIFSKICRFYTMNGIPFFLFGPGLTIGNVTRFCTAVITGFSARYENKAVVCTNFASNLFGDTVIMTAPRLLELLEACPSQMPGKKRLSKYVYPEELLSVSDMQTICKGGVDYAVRRNECAIVGDIDGHPKRGGLFGEHWLLSKAKAKAKAKAEAEAGRAIHVTLSDRERKIVERLS